MTSRSMLMISLVVPLVATASTMDCDLKPGPNDVVARGRDAVVEAGRTAEAAVALDGNVIVRKGAHVRTAMALNGDVTIEADAQVEEAVITLGGHLIIAPTATIEGARVEIGDGIHITGKNGGSLTLDGTVDGKRISQRLVDEVVKGLGRCVEASDAKLKSSTAQKRAP